MRLHPRSWLIAAVLLATASAAPAQQPVAQGTNQVAQRQPGAAPIRVTDRIFLATGFGNTFMVRTDDGSVIIDTSSAANAPVHREQLRGLSDAPVRAIILTHAHEDHAGGVALWREPGTQVIGQQNQVEFRNFMTRLQGFFASRNAAQFGGAIGGAGRGGGGGRAGANPGNYAAPALSNVLFEKEHTLRVGGLTFQSIATPGETPDHLTVWIPELKAAFVGDNYYGSFPNLYTLRGTKPRWALEYVESLNKVLALKPELVLPSHGQPIVGAARVQTVLTQYRDAILFVHDATVRGMNEGKDVYTLMKTVKLPPALEVGESYGAISWTVRGIYEGYAGYFDGDAATMYPVSPDDAYRELAKLAGGATPIAARAQAVLAAGDAPLALRLTQAALDVEPGHRGALTARRAALQKLLANSANSNESGWLRSALGIVEAQLR